MVAAEKLHSHDVEIRASSKFHPAACTCLLVALMLLVASVVIIALVTRTYAAQPSDAVTFFESDVYCAYLNTPLAAFNETLFQWAISADLFLSPENIHHVRRGGSSTTTVECFSVVFNGTEPEFDVVQKRILYSPYIFLRGYYNFLSPLGMQNATSIPNITVVTEEPSYYEIFYNVSCGVRPRIGIPEACISGLNQDMLGICTCNSSDVCVDSLCLPTTIQCQNGTSSCENASAFSTAACQTLCYASPGCSGFFLLDRKSSTCLLTLLPGFGSYLVPIMTTGLQCRWIGRGALATPSIVIQADDVVWEGTPFNLTVSASNIARPTFVTINSSLAFAVTVELNQQAATKTVLFNASGPQKVQLFVSSQPRASIAAPSTISVRPRNSSVLRFELPHLIRTGWFSSASATLSSPVNAWVNVSFQCASGEITIDTDNIVFPPNVTAVTFRVIGLAEGRATLSFRLPASLSRVVLSSDTFVLDVESSDVTLFDVTTIGAATQSSTGCPLGCEAFLAIRSNVTFALVPGQMTSYRPLDVAPWWQLSFARPLPLASVVIGNKADTPNRLRDLSIVVFRGTTIVYQSLQLNPGNILGGPTVLRHRFPFFVFGDRIRILKTTNVSQFSLSIDSVLAMDYVRVTSTATFSHNSTVVYDVVETNPVVGTLRGWIANASSIDVSALADGDLCTVGFMLRGEINFYSLLPKQFIGALVSSNASLLLGLFLRGEPQGHCATTALNSTCMFPNGTVVDNVVLTTLDDTIAAIFEVQLFVDFV